MFLVVRVRSPTRIIMRVRLLRGITGIIDVAHLFAGGGLGIKQMKSIDVQDD